MGHAQLDILEAEGVPAGRVIVGHCDTVADTGYHRSLAERGAFVQFDTIQGESDYDTQLRIGFVRSLVDAGLGDRVLLSGRVPADEFRAMGGPGYAYLPETFAGLLVAAGVSPVQVMSLMVDNPRRALTGETA